MRRILVSAYACEPGRGSEGEIGWSLVHELARQNEVWVITRANNRSVHDAAFALAPKPPTLHFVYYDTPNWARWYKRGKRLFLLYYYVWQIASSLVARRIVRAERIDLVHHLTGGMDWMPSGLAFTGIPFVWGPIGSERTHPGIRRLLPVGQRVKEWVRSAVAFWERHMDPMVRVTGSRATLILSHTPDVLPRRYGKKIEPFVQTGIHPTARFAKMKSTLSRGECATIIFAGELIHWKGAQFAVDSFLACARRRPDVRLVVIGDGPLRHELEKSVAESGLGSRVAFTGRLPMAQLIDALATGDVFLYPSYHHGLATVVLQAMLTGLPVVCLGGDAIGRTVGSECGITVDPSHADVVQELAHALDALLDDEPRRKALAASAQQRVVADYAYAVIGARYESVFEEALKRGRVGS